MGQTDTCGCKTRPLLGWKLYKSSLSAWARWKGASAEDMDDADDYEGGLFA